MKEQSLDNHWHDMDVKEALKRLEASEEGLTGDEANRRLEEAGPNSLWEACFDASCPGV